MRFSFCLGFRNWHVDHLKRGLMSIRRTAPTAPLTLVDLGSAFPTVAHVRAIAQLNEARLIECQAAQEWSRSLALNIAARETKDRRTDYFVFTDADMLFPPDWLPVVQTQVEPRSIILTRSRDFTEQVMTGIDRMDLTDMQTLFLRSIPHPDVGQGAAMIIPRDWFFEVGGFDELYKIWGCEDNDMVLRAQWAGLVVQWAIGTFVVHQWHDRNWPTQEQHLIVRANRYYMEERMREQGPIQRNGALWGQVPTLP